MDLVNGAPFSKTLTLVKSCSCVPMLILRSDPSFSSSVEALFESDLDWVCFIVLRQDKWRNMSVIANGWGSREKSRLAVKRTHSLPKQEATSLANTSPLQSDEEMADATGTSAPNVRSENDHLRLFLLS